MDILFLLGKGAALNLIGWAVGGKWERSDTSGLVKSLLTAVVDDLGALQADIDERLDRIEGMVSHLVSTTARTKLHVGLRQLADASAAPEADRGSALRRASDSFYEAAESAREAMSIHPAMAGVAGDAELYIAATRLAMGDHGQVPEALMKAEQVYREGIRLVVSAITSIDDVAAQRHFSSHSSRRQRLSAKIGNEVLASRQSLEELQAPLARQLPELVARLNRYRSTIKSRWADPEDCGLVVPLSNNLYTPWLTDPFVLPTGIELQSLRLAVRPVAPLKPVALGDVAISLVAASDARATASLLGHDLFPERTAQLIVVPRRYPSRLRLVAGPHLNFKDIERSDSDGTAARVSFPARDRWLQVIAVPSEWRYSPTTSIPADSMVALLPVP